METRAVGKRPATHPLEDPPGRRPSKDLKRAAEAAQAFTSFSSPQAQNDTIGAEQRIWEKVESAKADGEMDVFKQWVKDPGYTTGRLALYDRALALYWANKQLISLLMDERSSKAGDEQKNDKIWRTHCRETHLVHIKLDIIAKKLGISFLPQDSAANVSKGGDSEKAEPIPAPPPAMKNG